MHLVLYIDGFINPIWHLKKKKLQYMKSSFPKRYKSILIVFMKMTFFFT